VSDAQTVNQNVEALVAKMEDLPTIPAAAARVLELAADPDAAARDVADAVAMDPSLTARVLRIVNSVAYGMSRQIKTINHAVVIMGQSALRSAVIGASVGAEMAINAERCGLAPLAFWTHSATCAIGSRLLARSFKMRNPGEAFVAGLLHDMGRLVLARYFPEQHRQALGLVKAEGLSIEEAEQKVLGCAHSHMGEWLAERWSLPEDIRCAARYHHQPAESPEWAEGVAVVHLADVLGAAVGADDCEGLQDGDGEPTVDPGAWQILLGIKRDLDKSEMQRFRNDTEDALEEAKAFASVMIS